MDEATEFVDYRRADVRFHIGVAEATGSPRIVAAMTEVQGQMSNLIARIAHPRAVLRSSNEQHRRLIAHLRRRDSASSVRVAREHTEGTEHILAGLLPK
jgi:DNA-binding GntR family transcriptional regulator